MKNIHILETDKPSRLHEYDYLSPMGLSKEPLQWRLGRNIYITSDEVKKQGEWVLSNLNEVVKFCSLYCQNSYKKIILTTDPSLAPDVQKIDDKFLEWFVKNPSCEDVEVERMFNVVQFTSREFIYKIIIPKEEPKQETLEEVAIDYCDRFFGKDRTTHQWNDGYTAFINGTKWQQERSYSEEEVLPLIEYFQWIIKRIDKEDTPEEIVRLLLLEKDKIEQFKKK